MTWFRKNHTVCQRLDNNLRFFGTIKPRGGTTIFFFDLKSICCGSVLVGMFIHSFNRWSCWKTSNKTGRWTKPVWAWSFSPLHQETHGIANLLVNCFVLGKKWPAVVMAVMEYLSYSYQLYTVPFFPVILVASQPICCNYYTLLFPVILKSNHFCQDMDTCHRCKNGWSKNDKPRCSAGICLRS